MFRDDIETLYIRLKTFVRFRIDFSNYSDSTAFVKCVTVFSYYGAIGDNSD
jgi:hypothetical protein